MLSSMRKRMKQAFSLIELLVVVAVILLLAGLLFPVLAKVKEMGRSARCASNLRQLQVATLNFVTDHDHFPLSTISWSQHGDGSWWHDQGWVSWYNYPVLGPYGSPQVGAFDWHGANGLACVTNGALWGYLSTERDVFLCPTFGLKSKCGQPDAMRSYSMNSNLSDKVFVDVNITGKASTTILFGDDRNVTIAPYDVQFGTNEVGQWHNNSMGNVVCVDGHVERR